MDDDEQSFNPSKAMMKQMAERYKKEQQEELKVIEEKKFTSKVKKPKDINKVGSKKKGHTKNKKDKEKINELDFPSMISEQLIVKSQINIEIDKDLNANQQKPIRNHLSNINAIEIDKSRDTSQERTEGSKSFELN